MNKTKLKGINTFKERLKILGLTCFEQIDEGFNTNKKYKLKDENGYLYSFSSMNLCTTLRRNGTIAIFFNNNPYSFENINNYFKINNIELELITKEPKNAIEPLEFRCLKHNEIFKRSWNSISNGTIKCDICTGITRYNIRNIKELVERKGCKFLNSSYDKIHDNYEFQCSCGEVFIRRLDVVLYNNSVKCPKCMGINVHLYDTVKDDLSNHDIELISDSFESSSKNIKIKYSCGFVTERTYLGIKGSEYRCPHCNKKGYKRDTDKFYTEIKELVGDEYTFNGEYINCDTKMNVVHNKCGYVYKVKPTSFINNGTRCPICTSSKSEENISRYFKDNDVDFIEQYTFKDLVGIKGGLLRFDFAVMKDKKLLFLLEYDGEYHYQPIEGEEVLRIQQEHDRRKNEYCKNNNIELHRIPYWEHDNLISKMEEILTREGLNG